MHGAIWEHQSGTGAVFGICTVSVATLGIATGARAASAGACSLPRPWLLSHLMYFYFPTAPRSFPRLGADVIQMPGVLW